MKEKALYLPPQCEEITVRLDGVIAVSDPSYSKTFGNPFSSSPEEEEW